MMPYRSMLSILATILFIHCSTPGSRKFDDLEEQFAVIIKKNLEDNAFKTTAELKIEEFIVLKVDTVTNKTLDSQLLIKTKEKIEFCKAMSDLYISMAESNARIGKLAKKLKRGSLQGNSGEDIKNDVDMSKVYIDSALYFQRMDSMISARISNMSAADSFYRVKVFIKATEKKENDSTNILGAQYYYFTKNKKIVDLSAPK